jgi:hypothetical protein
MVASCNKNVELHRLPAIVDDLTRVRTESKAKCQSRAHNVSFKRFQENAVNCNIHEQNPRDATLQELHCKCAHSHASNHPIKVNRKTTGTHRKMLRRHRSSCAGALQTRAAKCGAGAAGGRATMGRAAIQDNVSTGGAVLSGDGLTSKASALRRECGRVTTRCR